MKVRWMLAADAFSLFEPAVQRELSRNLRVSVQRKACWNLQKEKYHSR